MGKPIARLVLTSGGNTYTYSFTKPNVLLRISHTEQPYSHTANVLIDDYNNVLSALSLKGYQGVISYGYKTSAGDDYTGGATAPIIVKAQEVMSVRRQRSAISACQLVLYGLPDQLAQDEAQYPYRVDDTDTKTIKTLITDICDLSLTDGTHTPYAHCTAVTVTFEPVSAAYPLGYDDDIIDDYYPADYFSISVGASRLAKIKELLGMTKCVMRFGDDGGLHIFNPTVSGSTYDYEYDDIDKSKHTFFSKVYRTRLVLPNKITVKSSDAHETQYAGSYTSAASYALLPKESFVVRRLTSYAQAIAIATAMIQKLEQDHEKGNGYAPLNCGQEVYDYIKITDSLKSDERIGNIGWLTREFEPGRFDFKFGFGSILLGSTIGLQGLPSLGGESSVTWSEFGKQIANIYNDMDRVYGYSQSNRDLIKSLTSTFELMQDSVPKWRVTEQMIIPSTP